jgi:hypothetical protein
VTAKDRDAIIKQLADGIVSQLTTESGVNEAVFEKTEYTLTEVVADPQSLKKVPMKDAGAFALDGDEPHTWDRKQGTCVFDYLVATFGNCKGFKKTCTLEALTELFRDYDSIEDEYKYGDPLTDGVCTEPIEIFCKKHGVPMYALDQDSY